MSARIDLVGQRFGKWTVLERDTNHPAKKSYWICICDCGTRKSVKGESLRRGLSTCCRCVYVKNGIQRTQTKHGKAGTKEYRTWSNIKKRVYKTTDQDYPRYGGRGIKMCERWNDFRNFYADMGDAPSPSHSIDRIDNDGDYSPENCRWATPSQQTRNSTKARMVTFNGETKSVTDWAEEYGLPPKLLMKRLYRGDSFENAVAKPITNSLKERANNMKSNRRVFYNGEDLTVTQFAEKYKVSRFKIYHRLDRGWSVEEALYGRK